MSPLDRFVTFIKSREAVRLRQWAGAVNPMYMNILAEWRFCNVNREDDRVTKWIAANLRTEKDPKTLVMKLAVGRFINWPDTLGVLVGNGEAFKRGWDGFAFVRQMARLQELGAKVYTGAYMIRAGTGDDAAMPKHEYLVKRVFNPLWSKLTGAAEPREKLTWPSYRTCAEWDFFLGNVFGMGDFMRNQIITDMKYTDLLPRWRTVTKKGKPPEDRSTPDWHTFCLAGPGTNRGLNRLDGSPLKTVRPSAKSNHLLLTLREAVLARFHGRADDKWWVDTFADLNNLSNCLCEFDKAERVRLGEGTPRSRYTPTKD